MPKDLSSGVDYNAMHGASHNGASIASSAHAMTGGGGKPTPPKIGQPGYVDKADIMSPPRKRTDAEQSHINDVSRMPAAVDNYKHDLASKNVDTSASGYGGSAQGPQGIGSLAGGISDAVKKVGSVFPSTTTNDNHPTDMLSPQKQSEQRQLDAIHKKEPLP